MFPGYKWHFQISQLPKQGTWESFPAISFLSLSISNRSLLPANSFSKSISSHSHSNLLIPEPCLKISPLMLVLTNSTHSSSLCLRNASEGATSPITSQGDRSPLRNYRGISLSLCISASQTDTNPLLLPDLGRVGEKHSDCDFACPSPLRLLFSPTWAGPHLAAL